MNPDNQAVGFEQQLSESRARPGVRAPSGQGAYPARQIFPLKCPFLFLLLAVSPWRALETSAEDQ